MIRWPLRIVFGMSLGVGVGQLLVAIFHEPQLAGIGGMLGAVLGVIIADCVTEAVKRG